MRDNKDFSSKALRQWSGAGDFINDWFITGFFKAGVQNAVPPPNLFDKKNSLNWRKDWLEEWGGHKCITDVPSAYTGLPPRQKICDLEWFPVECDAYMPDLKLSRIRSKYAELDSAMDKTDAGDMQWYALAVLESDESYELDLIFSVWDGTILYLNGEEVFEEHSWHHVIVDMEKIRIKIKKGINTLLFKNERDGLIARLQMPDGRSAENHIKAVGRRKEERQDTISGKEQIKHIALEMEVENRFSGESSEELAAWRNKFRKILRNTLGKTLPVKRRNSGNIKIIEETRCTNFLRRLVHIRTAFSDIIPAYIFIPYDSIRNGKTLLAVHGHSMTWKIVSGIEPAPKLRAAQTGPATDNYAELLADKGFVTACFCERAFEERGDIKGKRHVCNEIDIQARMIGYSLIGLNIQDIHRVADALCLIDGVNGDKLGLTGLSGGGTTSCYAGAFDDRFAAIASFCGVFSMIDKFFDGGCGMQNIMGLYPKGDMSEILSLIAPRPLMIAQGRYDNCFNVIRTKAIYDQALRAYAAAGVPEKAELYIYGLAHQYEPKEAVKFFSKYL